MIDIDGVLGKKKKSKGLDFNAVLPKFPKTKMPEYKNNDGFFNRTKIKLTTLDGEKSFFGDPDRDMIPNAIDNAPRKKLIWEKTMQSIYRSEKDR